MDRSELGGSPRGLSTDGRLLVILSVISWQRYYHRSYHWDFFNHLVMGCFCINSLITVSANLVTGGVGKNQRRWRRARRRRLSVNIAILSRGGDTARMFLAHISS